MVKKDIADEDLLRRFAPTSIADSVKDLRDGIRHADDDTIIRILTATAGQLDYQAVCKAELDRRQRERQNRLFSEQMKALMQQHETARLAARAAQASAIATIGLLLFSIVQFLNK